MNSPTSPLSLRSLPSPDRQEDRGDHGDALANTVFKWPTPPFASYAETGSQNPFEPCEFTGLNGRKMSARLTAFYPDDELAQVQLPPARTTMPMRFWQFRSLTLLTPIPVQALPADHHSHLIQQRPRSNFHLHFKDGHEMEGTTIGHIEHDYGIFLFPPHDDQDSVLRLFVPRSVLSKSEIGPRIGDVLLDHQATTAEQIEEAADMQKQLREKKIGDILVMQKIVSPEQLLNAIDTQSKMPMVRIGEALIALDLITNQQLEQALSEQKRDRSIPLGELLVRLNMVSRAELQNALARKMGYPLVDVQAFPIEEDALRKIPYMMAARLKALPLMIRAGSLIVAVENPSDRSVIDEMEFASQGKVAPVMAQHGTLESVIPEAYARIGVDVSRSSLTMNSFIEPDETLSSNDLVQTLEKEGLEAIEIVDDRPIEQSDNSLVRLINTMIIEAHQQGVSDIHIESYPGHDKIKIRFRKDGLLKLYLELPHTYRNATIARIKIMCDLDISERRKPQDGKMNFAKFSPQHKLELRIATIPTNNGLEDVVMRILASAKPLPLDKLGFSPSNLKSLQWATERPYGMILCVGPTGSGKTTTLHSALAHINVPERKIWTAEDPVEITQPGLRQVQVNPKIDWTFAKALRAFLRADPDVVMVGEIRDTETAHMAVEASLTGHLVMSTLHTNSAPETITRLLDMGMDPFNFADSLLSVLAQRLVRRLCKNCSTSRPATEEEIDELIHDYQQHTPADHPEFKADYLRQDWLNRFGVNGQLMHYHSPGCTHCNNTGFKGRAGLHELMTISRDLRRLIQTGGRVEELQRQALLDGMRTLRHDGIEKVLAGVTSIDEVRATSNV